MRPRLLNALLLCVLGCACELLGADGAEGATVSACVMTPPDSLDRCSERTVPPVLGTREGDPVWLFEQGDVLAFARVAPDVLWGHVAIDTQSGVDLSPLRGVCFTARALVVEAFGIEALDDLDGAVVFEGLTIRGDDALRRVHLPSVRALYDVEISGDALEQVSLENLEIARRVRLSGARLCDVNLGGVSAGEACREPPITSICGGRPTRFATCCDGELGSDALPP